MKHRQSRYKLSGQILESKSELILKKPPKAKRARHYRINVRTMPEQKRQLRIIRTVESNIDPEANQIESIRILLVKDQLQPKAQQQINSSIIAWCNYIQLAQLKTMASSYDGKIGVYQDKDMQKQIGTINYKLSVKPHGMDESQSAPKEQSSLLDSSLHNTNPAELQGLNQISMNMNVYDQNLDKSTPIRSFPADGNMMLESFDDAEQSIDKVSSLLRRDKSQRAMQLTTNLSIGENDGAESPERNERNNSNQSKISPKPQSQYDIQSSSWYDSNKLDQKSIDEIIQSRQIYEKTLAEIFPDYPVSNSSKIRCYQDFVASMHEQTSFLQQNNRLDLIKGQFSQSQRSIQEYQDRIQDLEHSIKSRDQRIEADSRILRQQKENEQHMKKLRAEMTKTQVEKNRMLQRQKDEFEQTIQSIVSKSQDQESENSRLKIEVARNMQSSREYEERLKNAIEGQESLRQQLNRFSSHLEVPNKQGPQQSFKDTQIQESVCDTSLFDRDEDATDINISQSLGLGKKTLKSMISQSNDKVQIKDEKEETNSMVKPRFFYDERHQKIINSDFGQTFDALGEDRDDLDSNVDQMDDNNNSNALGLNEANNNIQVTPSQDEYDGKDDSLDYSAGTGTLGASSLNFGFTANKSQFHNNLTQKAAQMNKEQHLKEQLDKNLNISNLSEINQNIQDNDITIENGIPDTGDMNNIFDRQDVDEITETNEDINFNLTQTQMLQNAIPSMIPLSQSVKNPSAKKMKQSSDNGNLNLSSMGKSSNLKNRLGDQTLQSVGKDTIGSPKHGIQGAMMNSAVSAASRGSGMSSGKFCLAADNIFSMNDKCQKLEYDKERLEQDKERLSNQLNKMLKSYKELSTKYAVANQIKESDEDGLEKTYNDLFSQIKDLQKNNDTVKEENKTLKDQLQSLQYTLEETNNQLTRTKKELQASMPLKANSKQTSAIQSNSAIEKDSDFSRDLDEDARSSFDQTNKDATATMLKDKTLLSKETDFINTEQYIQHITLDEKMQIDQFVNKYVDKFFKIYKKINVKVESKEILKEELDYKKPLLGIFDSISGHLNKVSNQLTQFMKETDNEVNQYKNIISNKLRPRMAELMEEINQMKETKQNPTKTTSIDQEELKSPDDASAQEIQNQQMAEQRKKMKKLEGTISELRGENLFQQDRLSAIQKQLQSQITNSPQVYLTEIKKLKSELFTKREAFKLLIQKIQKMQPTLKSKSDRYISRGTKHAQAGATDHLSSKSKESNSPTFVKRGNNSKSGGISEKKAQRPGSHSVVKKATSNLRVHSSQIKYKSIRQKSEQVEHSNSHQNGRVASAGQNYQLLKPKVKNAQIKNKRPTKISPENRSTKSSPIEISDNNESPTFLRKRAFGRKSKSVGKVQQKVAYSRTRQHNTLISGTGSKITTLSQNERQASIPNSTLSNDYFDKIAGRTHDDDKQNKQRFENLLPDIFQQQQRSKTFKQTKIQYKKKEQKREKKQSTSKMKTLRDEQIMKFRRENEICKMKIAQLEKQLSTGMGKGLRIFESIGHDSTLNPKNNLQINIMTQQMGGVQQNHSQSAREARQSKKTFNNYYQYAPDQREYNDLLQQQSNNNVLRNNFTGEKYRRERLGSSDDQRPSQSQPANTRSIINRHRENALSYKPLSKTKTPQYVSRKIQLMTKSSQGGSGTGPSTTSKVTNVRNPGGYNTVKFHQQNKPQNGRYKSLVVSSERIGQQ